MKDKVLRVCKGCGVSFEVAKGNNKKLYHSVRCRQKATMVERPHPELSSGSKGALHELLVAADLIKRGFTVFRSMSQNSEADLVILKDGELLLVEVTTGTRHPNGVLHYPPHKKHAHIYDVIAVVEGSQAITYFPDIERGICGG